MSNITKVIENTDVATRQVLFFYELVKAGVVKFNLKNDPTILKLIPVRTNLLSSLEEANAV